MMPRQVNENVPSYAKLVEKVAYSFSENPNSA
jgi:hypothetical protein